MAWRKKEKTVNRTRWSATLFPEWRDSTETAPPRPSLCTRQRASSHFSLHVPVTG